jgi:hypothetical protein
MKCHIRRRGLIVISALALALCFLQPPIHAEETTEHIVMFPSIGLAPGQRLRLTLFNPDGEPVRAQARSHHSGGIQVVMGDGSVRLVRGGTFHSFDLNRSDIPVNGEEGTGRVQLRASCWIRVSQPWTKIDGLAVSLETIEISDGTSNTIMVGEVMPTAGDGGGRDVLIGGDGRDVLMGIVPGQTLRVTIFNPPSFDSEAGSEPQRTSVNGHVKIFDGSGSVIAQSEQAVIPQGAFRSFDFDRDSLPAGTGIGRQQLRIRPFFDFQSERLPPLLVSIEIVDNSTGKTQVLSGPQCLVFFLGGIPAN